MPHFDYCDVIFHSPAISNLFDSSINLSNLMQMLDSTQYQAALAITDVWKGTSQNKIYDELGWETLPDRRWSRRLSHIFKIINNNTTDYLKLPLPPVRRLLYGVYHHNLLQEIWCRTNNMRTVSSQIV